MLAAGGQNPNGPSSMTSNAGSSMNPSGGTEESGVDNETDGSSLSTLYSVILQDQTSLHNHGNTERIKDIVKDCFYTNQFMVAGSRDEFKDEELTGEEAEAFKEFVSFQVEKNLRKVADITLVQVDDAATAAASLVRPTRGVGKAARLTTTDVSGRAPASTDVSGRAPASTDSPPVVLTPRLGWLRRFGGTLYTDAIEVKVNFVTNRSEDQNIKPVPIGARRTIAGKPDHTIIEGHCTIYIPREDPDAVNTVGRRVTLSNGISEPYLYPGYGDWSDEHMSAENVALFIHGYNNSFETAVGTAARMAVALGLDDFSYMCYSWPAIGGSIASARFYLNDLAALEASERHFTEFLQGDRLEGKKVHIIGHSMGCRMLIRGLLRVDKSAMKLQLQSVVFCAADVDTGMFTLEVELLTAKFPDCQFILLASRDDRALGFSKALHGENRAGLLRQNQSILMDSCPTFDLSDDNGSWISTGHGYYASSYWSLHLIRELLRDQAIEVIVRDLVDDQVLVEIQGMKMLKFLKTNREI